MFSAMMDVIRAMFDVIRIAFRIPKTSRPIVYTGPGLMPVAKSPAPGCYCPKCRRNLQTDPGAYSNSDEHSPIVIYSCQCGEWSRWQFDTPVPLYLGSPS